MHGGRGSYDTYQALRWPFGRRSRSGGLAALWYRDVVREPARHRQAPVGWALARREVDEAALLEDLAGVGESTAEATLVLGRVLALRLALRASAQHESHHEVERAATIEYIGGCRTGPVAREHRVLTEVARLTESGPSSALARSLLAAADDAARHGHFAGAFECYRAAFDVAVATGAADIGAPAATALARLSAALESEYAMRAWRRRARVLARRAAHLRSTDRS